MPVYRDKKNNTWYVKGRYKDWTGKTKDLTKRGFTLKRDAVEWEENFHLRLDSSLYMTFAVLPDLQRGPGRPPEGQHMGDKIRHH